MPNNHEVLLEAYKAIAAILDKHGITFYGMCGTALGAVRHNGFIPWDDDLDIAVYAKDIDVINKILKEELDSEKYYYHNPSGDTHPHVLIKTPDFINDIKQRKAPFIDLFVLMDVPESKIKQAIAYPFIGFELLSTKIIDESRFKIVRELFFKVMLVCRKVIRLLSTEKTDLVGVRNVHVSARIWKRAYFGKPKLHVFEDIMMPLPNDWNSFLTEFYGDYMTPPPEDKRGGAAGYPYNLLRDYEEDLTGVQKHRRLLRKDLPR